MCMYFKKWLIYHLKNYDDYDKFIKIFINKKEIIYQRTTLAYAKHYMLIIDNNLSHY